MFEELGLNEFTLKLDDKINLPDPVQVTYWQARKNRTFYLDYILDEAYDAVELAKIIIQMNVSEKDIPEKDLLPIYLWIFSPGGDTYQCDALCDIIEASRIPVVTINMGIAMSSGFFIFLAGKRRYSFEKGTFLVHDGYLNLQGRVDEVDSAHKNYKKELDRTKKYVLSHTLIDEKTYKKNQSRDWYIDAQEAEELGICKVVKSFDEIV